MSFSNRNGLYKRKYKKMTAFNFEVKIEMRLEYIILTLHKKTPPFFIKNDRDFKT